MYFTAIDIPDVMLMYERISKDRKKRYRTIIQQKLVLQFL